MEPDVSRETMSSAALPATEPDSQSGNESHRRRPGHESRLGSGNGANNPRPTTDPTATRPGRSCLPGSKQPEVATRSGVVHRVARIRCFDARETTRSRHSMPGLAVRHHRVATFCCFNCPTADLDPPPTPTPNRNVQIAPSDTSTDCAYHHQNALRPEETPKHHIHDAHPSRASTLSRGACL